MSLPESMSRIVIVGAKSHYDETIDVLYDLSSIHLIDQTVDADEGFTLGVPRPYSPKASERLLKVRAMEKDLGIDKHVKAEPMAQSEVESKISSDSVELVDGLVRKVIDERNDLNQRITELNATKKNLELLSALPIDLELYSGYKSIFSMVGTINEDPTDKLNALNVEVFSSFNKKEGNVIAVFGKLINREEVQNILSSCGFSEIQVPPYTGSAANALTKVNHDIADAEANYKSAQKEVEALFEKHKSFLKASEEELSIVVQKGEIPVRVANSEYSFVMDAWVPTAKVDFVKNTIETQVEGVYVECQETRGRAMKEADAVDNRFKMVPTKFNNGKIVKEFQYPTKLVSVPKYQEIDPSVLIAIFLPMFFGLMVGDVGYAIPFIILGAYGLKVTHHKDWRAIATVLFFGGIWAFIFGFFFFGECLGMHFIGEGHLSVEYTWQTLLGLDNLPGVFDGLLPYETGVGKLHEVGFLLKLSVYIGIVHLLIGYCCAVYNKSLQYGFKEGFLEKGGWIFGFLGIVVFCYGLTEVLISGKGFDEELIFIILGAVLIVIEIAMNIKHEGAQAILELPGIVGNILSYTRLAAIGMSKAGMALAFNYIAIGMVADGLGGIAGIVLGFLLFAFMHLMVWTLAILSAGLHGLRLQFVELMAKFFEGGGVEYNPLKIKRKQTVSDNTTKEV